VESTSLRTFIGSVMCLDLVGYSKVSVARQIEIKDRFNERLRKAIARVPEDDRVILDTGDGAMIGFLSDPGQCFEVALKVRDAMNASEKELGGVRIGIHLGSVKLAPGMSGGARLVGDGINVAERIATLAEPGEIVVTRAFHDMVSRLTDKYEALFRDGGVRNDRQGQPHEVFVVAPQPRAARAVSPSPALLIAIASAAIVAIGGATWWLAAGKKPASVPQAPFATDATKIEPSAPPPVQAKPEAVVVAPEPKKAPPPRVEQRPEAPRSSAPASEGRKVLSAITGGARDVARNVGSTASNVFSAVTQKAKSITPGASPPPTVVSRAAIYFPQEAARQGIHNGVVRARLAIDAAGDVTHVAILSADPPQVFEQEAVRSLRKWRFNSGSDGRTYDAEVEFKR
jgi:TonB family protein